MDNSMYEGVEFVAHDLETMRKQFDKLRYDYKLLHNKFFQTEDDRDMLAAEVKAWRRWYYHDLDCLTDEAPDHHGIMNRMEKTDDSGALTRARETE